MRKKSRLYGNPLTERESEVFVHIVDGWSNQDIADFLVISERTVRTHASHIFAKLGAHNRTDAARIAREMGIEGGEVVPDVTLPRYGHRNGEAQPPTEPGLFWMEILLPFQRTIMEIAVAQWGEWRKRQLGKDWEPYLPDQLYQAGARWWGPELPPWYRE